MGFLPNTFLPGSNIYEVNMRQYTPSGKIIEFAKHMPRLRKMGIDILWFMPLTPISIKERKGSLGSYYAAADYWKINPEFGSNSDFKDLVNQAHQLGFKVIVDWVANHTGWDHTWTSSHPEYFRRNEAGTFYERNGWEDVIDLDYSSVDMRSAMIQAMQYWIDQFDIDGFRCDMAMLVPLDFWQSARTHLDKTKPLIWLAECEDPAYLSVFDMMYGWEWMHTTAAVSRGQQQAAQLQQLLDKYEVYTAYGRHISLFTSNHDENSWNGTEFERYGQAAGLFAALSMLLPNSIPLIYSGQELPLKHRLKFFDKDEIPWTITKPELENFYFTLLSLRKSNLNYKKFHPNYEVNKLVDNDKIFSLHIGVAGNEDIIGIFNLSSYETHFKLHHTSLSGVYQNVFTDGTFNPAFENNMMLAPFDFRVYKNTGM